jgi:hypothetical protein
MQSLTEEQRRVLIADFYRNHQDQPKSFTVNYFSLQGIPKRTTYSILKNLLERGSVVRAPGSGGLNQKLSQGSCGAIIRHNVNKKGVSQRQLAQKYNVHQSTICRMFKRSGVKCFKREKAPLYTEDQLSRVKRNARILAAKLQGKMVLIDDESYFKLKSDYNPGNNHYFTKDRCTTPSDVRYMATRKFPPQLLVWLCVSPRGLSEPFFLERPNSMDGNTYREECIQRRLVPFIQRYHATDSIIFWPDLASAHYARQTTALLQDLNVPFVQRDENPPNLPQCRPIENFWSSLKAAVYQGGWEAESIAQLRRRIVRTLKILDLAPLFHDFDGLQVKLRKVGRLGPLSVI